MYAAFFIFRPKIGEDFFSIKQVQTSVGRWLLGGKDGRLRFLLCSLVQHHAAPRAGELAATGLGVSRTKDGARAVRNIASDRW